MMSACDATASAQEASRTQDGCAVEVRRSQRSRWDGSARRGRPARPAWPRRELQRRDHSAGDGGAMTRVVALALALTAATDFLTWGFGPH
jgi:hypothetical protein